MSSESPASEAVVLLHGFAAHWVMMTRLQRRFREAGFEPVNWGYNSWFKPIHRHAERLSELLCKLDSDPKVTAIHFATHSMGCVVTRAALQKYKPSKAGRWVMYGPPNQGSFVANKVPRFVKSVLRPIDEMQAKSDSYVNSLSIPQDMDIAIVEATMDYIVAGSLTHITEEKDRLVVPGLHSQMLFREDVAAESIHFLEHGRFAHESTEASTVTTES